MKKLNKMTKEQKEVVDLLLDNTAKTVVMVVTAYLIGWAFTKGMIKAAGKPRGFVIYKAKG